MSYSVSRSWFCVCGVDVFVFEVLFLQEGTRVDASDILNISFGLYIIVWGYPPPTNNEIFICSFL